MINLELPYTIGEKVWSIRHKSDFTETACVTCGHPHDTTTRTTSVEEAVLTAIHVEATSAGNKITYFRITFDNGAYESTSYELFRSLQDATAAFRSKYKKEPPMVEVEEVDD